MMSVYSHPAVTANAQTHTSLRSARQHRVNAWCAEAFGSDHAASIPERALRLIEEALEAAQAAGINSAMAHRLVNHVYSRPTGELEQELGGVGLTLLALASAAGLDADHAEQQELNRVLSKPASHFTARNAAKIAAGLSIISAHGTEVDAAILPMPADLHPRTADLIRRFAVALGEKLAVAERKYGWDTHWESPAWMDQCREQLVAHVAKGDPRDVAAYSAFLWHHGERTALPTTPVPGGLVDLLREATDVLEAVGSVSKELPSNWRWPLADELSGMAAMLNAAPRPGPGNQTASEDARKSQAAIEAQPGNAAIGR